MLRVLIVDDSRTARAYLESLLRRDGSMEIVGLAVNGEEAVTMAMELQPDVVVMDIYMPKLDGFEATRRLMQQNPLPVVLCSAAWGPEEIDKTMQAMQAGAVTIVAKPQVAGRSGSAQNQEKRFVQTVKTMAEVRVVRRLVRPAPSERGGATCLPEGTATAERREIIAVGSSTGGPPVLQTILAPLPTDFSIPILVVQHIADGFLPGFVTWLQGQVKVHVEIAEQGKKVEAGHVYFAPNNVQLGISPSGQLILDDDSPAEANLRPAVSYLFRSVARSFGPRAVGVLLTGMGRDGAVELKQILDRGGLTIAQDRESAAVYGMPQEAFRIGAARHVMSPAEIGGFLLALALKQDLSTNSATEAKTRRP